MIVKREESKGGTWQRGCGGGRGRAGKGEAKEESRRRKKKGQQRFGKKRRKKKRGKKSEKDTWTQEVWRFPFTCQVIRWWCVFTPRRCHNQNAPLQITATDNKQLFSRWMRAGDETKVFLSRWHMCLRTSFAQRSHMKKIQAGYIFYLCFCVTFRAAGILVTVSPRSI